MLNRKKITHEIKLVAAQDNLIGVCKNCGSTRTSFFIKGSFVFVRPKGDKPFYGIIIDTELVDDEPHAIIDRGNDKSYYHIDTIYHVGEENIE